MKIHLPIVVAFPAILYLSSASLTGQTPFVKITSPPNGTVVHPGERVPVTVDATPFAFGAVIVLPYGTAASLSGPPYRFVFEVPTDLASGDLLVGALGVPPAGFKSTDTDKDAVKDTIKLDLERPESPKRLTAELSDFYNVRDGFHHVGENRYLRITGIFGGDGEVDLTISKLTKYQSSAVSVVTVNAEGLVTAVGPGSAKITVKNGNATVVVPVTVPKGDQRVPCPMNPQKHNH